MTATVGNYQESPNQLFTQGLYQESAAKKHRLGTLRQLDDGRMFVYCKAGGTALGAGLLNTYLGAGTNEQTVTVAHAKGTKIVTVTEAGCTLNLYQDGYLVVTAGAGIGEMYKIRGNSPAGDPSGDLVQFHLYDGLRTAWSASTTDVTVYESPYAGQVVNPTDAQQFPIGVATFPVTALYYFWAQVRGFAALQLDVPSAACLELDEKLIKASLNHAGFGFVVDGPDATKILAGYRPNVGYIVGEADHTDNEAALVYLTLL